MFIKLTVTNFLTLKLYCFWTLRWKYWIWPKQKGCQILCFFCSRIAASTKRGEAWRKNQEEIKSMSPTLIDEPLCKTGINHRCTFFSWETCGMFISFRATETLSILSLLNVILCWTFTSRTNIEIDLKKHATKSWIPASHPVHLQFQQIKPVCPTLRYQPLCKIGVKKLALSLFTWDSSEMFTFIIFVKSKSRTKSPAHQGHTEIDSKKGYQILETNTSPCPIFALETWRGSLKITSVPANLDRWISLRKLALKVRRNCVLGKIVMTCLSTLSPLKTFQSGQLIWGMQKKSMAKIQEVHGFIRFTDKTCMS